MNIKNIKILKNLGKMPLKDDLGECYCLYRIQYLRNKNNATNNELVVLSVKIQKYHNGEKARRSEMFFKNNNNLEKYLHRGIEIGGKHIVLVYMGSTAMFEPYPLLDRKDHVCGVRVKPIVLENYLREIKQDTEREYVKT